MIAVHYYTTIVISLEGAICSTSHQSLEVCQVNVAVLVHLDHLHLHARHLSARWVGAVRRLWDQTDLKEQHTASGPDQRFSIWFM